MKNITKRLTRLEIFVFLLVIVSSLYFAYLLFETDEPITQNPQVQVESK